MNLSPHKSRQDWTCRRFTVVKVKVCEEKKKREGGRSPGKREGKSRGKQSLTLPGSSTKILARPKLSIWEALLPSSTGLPQYPLQARACDVSQYLAWSSECGGRSRAQKLGICVTLSTELVHFHGHRNGSVLMMSVYV